MSNNKQSTKELERAKKFERYKILWEISEASPIIRRYFAMNFFDGVLTALGIVLSGFVFFLLRNPENIPPTQNFIFFSGLTTAIAIGISGLTGSHLAETTERKLNVIQMKQVLGLSPNNNSPEHSERKWSENDLRLALGKFEHGIREKKRTSTIPISLHLGLTPDQAKKLGVNPDGTRNLAIELPDEPKKHKKSKRLAVSKFVTSQKKNKTKPPIKTIYEEAQSFAGKIAAAVDGFSPFIGVIIVVLPFVFGVSGDSATITQYIISFILTVIVLFLLGSYLASISRESWIRYGTQMVLAAVLTGILTVTLGYFVQGT